MFATRKFMTAARLTHSSNVDELMEAFADQARPVRQAAATPTAEQVSPTADLRRSIAPVAGSASGAIAADVSFKPLVKAA